jgi:hypothetical protein
MRLPPSDHVSGRPEAPQTPQETPQLRRPEKERMIVGTEYPDYFFHERDDRTYSGCKCL